MWAVTVIGVIDLAGIAALVPRQPSEALAMTAFGFASFTYIAGSLDRRPRPVLVNA